MEAAKRVGWVLDYLREIESDLSVFHRIDDVEEMDAGRYMRLAQQLPHYRGALRDRWLRELQDETPQQPQPTQAPGEVRLPTTDLTPERAAAGDPLLRGLVEYSSG